MKRFLEKLLIAIEYIFVIPILYLFEGTRYLIRKYILKQIS